MTDHRPRGLLIALTACIAVGVGALGLSIQNAVEINQQADAREADRVAADLAGCERGNVFRQQIIDIGEANEEMITAILDTTFQTSSSSPERAAAIEALRRRLDVPIETYHDTVAAIQLVDCTSVVPGAKEPT